MADVLLKSEGITFGLKYSLGDLEGDEGLETAIAISLFTDARVLPEELPSGETDKRGFWGDEITPEDGDPIGSKLFLLEREKVTEETRTRAQEYAREALRWLVNEGLASDVTVAALISGKDRIDLDITIFKPSEAEKIFVRYQLLWEGQEMISRRL